MSLKRKLSALVGAAALTASLTACGTGGETDDGSQGEDTPSAEATDDDSSEDEAEPGGGSADSSGDE